MIHTHAIVDPKAEIAEGVTIGPFSVIGPGVVIDTGTTIGSHVVIQGPGYIGKDNVIHQFASLGDAPQDKGYKGEPTRFEIGDRNVVREYVTINRGTVNGRGVTRLGNDNFMMAYSHLAHDCLVGDRTIFANAASLAGHVVVEDWVIMGGFAIAHQFCRIGAHSFCALGSVIFKDVPPYATVSGNPASPHGINAEGLRRRGFTSETIQKIRNAHKILYKSKLPLAKAQVELAALGDTCEEVAMMERFIAESTRSIVR